jgi:hypothetical protein
VSQIEKGTKGEWGLNLEFTFEKIVVDIEGTPFAVKVGLGIYQNEWRRPKRGKGVRKSSFQTSWRSRRGNEVGESRRGSPLCQEALGISIKKYTNVCPMT